MYEPSVYFFFAQLHIPSIEYFYHAFISNICRKPLSIPISLCKTVSIPKCKQSVKNKYFIKQRHKNSLVKKLWNFSIYIFITEVAFQNPWKINSGQTFEIPNTHFHCFVYCLYFLLNSRSLYSNTHSPKMNTWKRWRRWRFS